MTPSRHRDGRGGRRAVTLLGVLLLFGAETVFAAALPLFAAGLPFGDPLLIGLALSLSGGAGFLLLPFAVRAIDGPGLRALVLGAGGVMLLSCLLVRESAALGPAALLLGSLGFGAARIVAVVGLLAMVIALPGPAAVHQGWNGALQRLGSLAAVLGSGTLLASGDWGGLFLLLAVVVAVWCGVAGRAARLARPARPREARGAGPRGAGRALATAAACVAAVRAPPVLAAAGLNVVILLVLMHGNSFLSIAVAEGLGPRATASLVLASLVLRDAVSVGSGLLFPVVVRRVGVRGMVWALALLAVLPAALLAGADPAGPGAAIAAVAHGVLVGWGIPTANLLAAGGRPGEAGLRIASSQLPAGLVLVVAPFAFGAAVAGLGAAGAYVLLALALAACAGVTVRASLGARLAA